MGSAATDYFWDLLPMCGMLAVPWMMIYALTNSQTTIWNGRKRQRTLTKNQTHASTPCPCSTLFCHSASDVFFVVRPYGSSQESPVREQQRPANPLLALHGHLERVLGPFLNTVTKLLVFLDHNRTTSLFLLAVLISLASAVYARALFYRVLELTGAGFKQLTAEEHLLAASSQQKESLLFSRMSVSERFRYLKGKLVSSSRGAGSKSSDGGSAGGTTVALQGGLMNDSLDMDQLMHDQDADTSMYDMAPEVGGVERARASGDALTSYNQLARGAGGGTPRTTRWGEEDPRDEEEEDRVRYGFGTVDADVSIADTEFSDSECGESAGNSECGESAGMEGADLDHVGCLDGSTLDSITLSSEESNSSEEVQTQQKPGFSMFSASG